ncbi:MAG: virulence RhuM family protein [Oscillospiraceae bacterium]|nr:virulence RhuM family protein [Oscillospiraceae bacterium]
MSKQSENGVVLYQDENGITRVSVRFADDDLWLTQKQIAEIYDTTQQNVSLHIDGVFKDGELDISATHKKFLLVQNEGKRQVKREISHYNLDVIIAIGYRVQSQIATRFRKWATERLHEYIQKGFAMDDERLRQGESRYFRELLQRIRDIRSSERNFYQQVTDIYATATDYDARADMTRTFFATIQNKLHYAVHENTAAEVIYKRVDNEKPLLGMTNFKGEYITKDDVRIAKNYLSEPELQRLNLLVSQFLDFAEFQALEQTPMTMVDWIAALDKQITLLNKTPLLGAGKISHAQAVKKAENEFEIYRTREMKQLESDFDRAVKMLTDAAKKMAENECTVNKMNTERQ